MAYDGPRLLCDHCRKEITGDHEMVENEAGVFHRGECYRSAVTECDVCGEPIVDIYRISNDSGDYHELCYERLQEELKRDALGTPDVVLVGRALVADDLIERLDEAHDRARGK